jgi:hypothetical protein
MNELEVAILVQDHLVSNAKNLVARRERDFNYAAERVRYAKDALHDEQVKLQRMREEFTGRVVP